MLATILTITIFLSLTWCGWTFHFISESLHGISLLDAGLLNVILYVLFACLPLLLLWLVFGFITQTLYNIRNVKNSNRLFAQMKKNQEYSDLLARIMLSSEQNDKCSFEMGRFDLLLADINELLSEFISRQRLADEDQIEYLWKKVQNGGKWSFGKVIIENFNRQPNFKQKVLVNVAADNMLAGTVMEFCARYQTLLKLLEKYDHEKIFLDLLETGVLGKVYVLLLPISNEIRRLREHDNRQEAPVETRPLYASEPKKETSLSEERDDFSMALAKSFGREETRELRADNFVGEARDNTVKQKPILSEPAELTETQKTLESLKKEWAEAPTLSQPSETNEDLTYPFGGWSDAQNYKK